MRAAPACILVALLALAGAARADSPLLHVRARTRLLAETTVLADGLLVEGEVIDARLRSGVPDREIVVTLSRHGRAQRFVTRADAHGRFVLRLPLGPGTHRVKVSTGQDALYAGAELAERKVELVAPIPRRFLVLPLGLTALLLCAGGLWRLRRRRRTLPTEDGREEAALRPGLHLGRAGRLRGLRAKDDRSFGGEVIDVHTRTPVAAAAITLAPDGGGPALELEADAAGRFTAEVLPAGRYQVTVRAPGYLGERFAITLPHRGELRGVRVELMPVRVRVLEVYRGVALDLLPDPDLLWVWTPRELLARAAGRPPLAELTRLVERAYYSGGLVDESAISEAERLAAEVSAAPPSRAAG